MRTRIFYGHMAAFLLIVDDYIDALLGYRTIFETQGYQVATALTPDEALACMRTQSPGLVIVDDDPGLMSGVDLGARLKRLSLELGRQPVPVIAVREDFSAGEEPVLIGVDYVLSKPLDFDHLDAVVRGLSQSLQVDRCTSDAGLASSC